MKKCALLSMITFLLSFSLIAQEAPKIKFEKVSEEELSMKTYPNDTTAEAVILFDDGSSYVKYEVENGFVLTYDRFVRIKILKQSGVEWGNFNIPLYSYNQNREEMASPKGTTFNLENGKVIKSELKKDAIFRERQNKYWETVRLSMPSVKIGSVIDLKYSIKTDLTWNLRSWKFQYTIPVKWSQYRVVYPEYYTYNHSSTGYHPLLYSKNTQKNETINYTKNEENDNGGFGSRSVTAVNQSISYMSQIFDYAANDVPAMKEEPYLTTLDNFTTQLKFELANVNFLKVGGKFKNYTTSWMDIAKQLNEEDNFGLQLKFNNFAEDAVVQLTKETKNDMEKLYVLYNHIQHTMKWDGSKSIFTTKNLKKTYADKTGNSSDINLLLAAMLNKAGITANPVILSTRQNGMLSFSHASISDCNYVIVQAIVNGKPILLDATEPNLQAGIIPFRCLNGEGHLINKEVSEPVKLSNPKSVENTIIELEMKDGKMTGIIKERMTGLSAFSFRESVKAAGGKQEHFDKIKNSSTDLDYLGYQYNKLDSLDQPVYIDYNIATKEKQESDAAIIYFNPILINRQKDNPFTSPTREYPVDFGISRAEVYTIKLTVPDGYSVEGLPKNESFLLDDKGGQFIYQISHVDNKIVLNYRFTIDKTLFLPSEYETLKNLYNLVINKQAEQIILKKTTI